MNKQTTENLLDLLVGLGGLPDLLDLHREVLTVRQDVVNLLSIHLNLKGIYLYLLLQLFAVSLTVGEKRRSKIKNSLPIVIALS